MNKEQTNKGISLIVLVITILVIIVLAGAVILTVAKNNPMDRANESVFKSDLKSFAEDLGMSIANEMAKGINSDNINADKTSSPRSITSYIPSMTGKTKYLDELIIIKGKLVYKKDTKFDINEKKWATETGVIETTETVKPTEPYANPYKITGFTPTSGTWDTGYVIKDNSNGNEFVWIPVKDIADFKRTDFGKQNGSYADYSETVPPEIITSVTTNGGYYIARYEAGTTIATADKASRNVTGIPVSKQGAIAWNYIDWNNSLANAKAMYSGNSEITSDLIYSTMWDTACTWLETSKNKTHAELLDSTSWGNYYDNTETGHGVVQTTGFKETWKANNIYDLAGNIWEWTNESYSSVRVYRGGSCNGSGSNSPVVFRNNHGPTSTYDSIRLSCSAFIKSKNLPEFITKL